MKQDKDIDEKARQRLLEDLGLEDDPNWKNASFQELVNYRREVPFYHFWYWEYQRRNPEYQEEFKNGDKKQFRKDHVLCDPQIGPTSTEILKSLCDGTFERKEPEPRFWYTQIGKDRHHVQVGWSFDEGAENNQTKISITCDPDLDHNLLLDYFKNILKWAEEHKPRAEELFKKQYDGKKVQDYMKHVNKVAEEQGIFSSEAIKIIDKKYPNWRNEWLEIGGWRTFTDIKFQEPQEYKPRGSDEQRAIGLWLWDYIQNNSQHKRCTQNQAIGQLKNEFGHYGLIDGYLNSDHRIIKRYIKLTDDCISEGEVLPFTTKKK